MTIKDINKILDQEIKFSQNSPLIDDLNEDFVDGFVKGLSHAKFLISAAEQESNKAKPYGISLTTASNVKEGEILWMTPDGRIVPHSTSGYIDIIPEPIPNLNKILEKYDGIIITGPRGSGKTTTALKIVNYLMENGNKERGIFIFPDSGLAKSSIQLAQEKGFINAGFNSTRSSLDWKNLSSAYIVSAMRPDSLKGPQSGILLLEEVDSYPSKPKDFPYMNAIDLSAYCHRLEYKKVIVTGTEYKERIKGTWLEKLNLYTYNLNLPI